MCIYIYIHKFVDEIFIEGTMPEKAEYALFQKV